MMSFQFIRSLVLTTGIFSMLLWFYIVVRIVVSGVDVHYPFVDSVPAISISAMGAFTFGVGFLCTFIYLAIWGNLDRRNAPK